MSDVTGPISTLPGSRHRVPAGTMCDNHGDRPAVARVQGETDSFGAEMLDLCQECVDNVKAETDNARCGCCDWCKNPATDLRPRRDFEEGMSGRVYDVCGKCVRAENARVEEELEESGFYNDYDDYDD